MMALALADVRELLATQSLAREITEVRRGSIRIETGFVYPDGTSIEIFVEPPADLCDAVARLSDFGQTTAWLLNVQVRPWQSRKRSAFLEDALRPYGVEQRDAELVYVLKDARDLPTGVLRLGQACLRVADLIFTRRASLQSVFAEEVEEVIADTELPYDADVELEGRFGRPVKVEFLVSGRRTRSAILTLAANNGSQAHQQANEIFRKWYDLRDEASRQRLTVWDDTRDVYRDDDIQRLAQTSIVVPGSDRKTLQELIAA